MNRLKTGENPKVTAILCTYGRFSCVERAVNCFLSQSHENRELVIFNTDDENPYLDRGGRLEAYGIMIVNNSRDRVTGLPYANVGAIRRDALVFAGGEYVITWDDDDIYLPHLMEQAMDRIGDTGLPSFKPAKSFFYSGNDLRLVQNTMEASVVASTSKVREYGYLLETGKEGLAWYTRMRDRRELDENDFNCVPSYCFNWNDGAEMKAPHKQSGDIDNPENFEIHKSKSTDRVDGREIEIYGVEKMARVYEPYLRFLLDHSEQFPKGLFERYISRSRDYVDALMAFPTH
jgi:glycosyltransferase involved in cell wall biosynthesis